jgi:hypothetical protein
LPRWTEKHEEERDNKEGDINPICVGTHGLHDCAATTTATSLFCDGEDADDGDIAVLSSCNHRQFIIVTITVTMG